VNKSQGSSSNILREGKGATTWSEARGRWRGRQGQIIKCSVGREMTKAAASLCTRAMSGTH